MTDDRVFRFLCKILSEMSCITFDAHPVLESIYDLSRIVRRAVHNVHGFGVGRYMIK